ncbi:MAG: cell wall-binding repeat-containing protein, partial [Erysipelotrichaceae bacterium]|nr:cell wall-binding repeat-containing protein [Erysipelotrichaceae bacterium]
TCTEKGTEERVCSRCDAKETREVPATGHKPGEAKHENEVAATCTEKGSYDLVVRCTVCNEVISSEHVVVDALGHDWNEPVYAWSEDNSTVTASRTCNRDASHVESETVNTASEITKPATCEVKGETTYTATFQNPAFTVEPKTVENISALGHKWNEPEWNWNEDHTQATATFTCENDPTDIRTVESTEAEVVEIPPTYEADGSKTYTVTVTGPDGKPYTETYIEILPQLGYDFKFDHFEWAQDYSSATAIFKDEEAGVSKEVPASVTSKTIQPTCEEEGKIIYTARVTYDGVEYSRDEEVSIPALSHTLTHHEAVAATCEMAGKAEYWECTVCHKLYSDAAGTTEVTAETLVVPASGHKGGAAVEENRVEATCTAAGSYDEVVYCSVCGKELSRETKIVPALGHDWSDWAQTKAPTCTAEGEESRTCSRCDAKETRTIEALGHALELVPGKAATCTEAGQKDYYECSRCQAKFYDVEGKNPVEKEEDLVIAALGHDYGEWTVTKEATCTEKGTEERVCSRCDAKETREVPATGHKPGEAKHENEVVATCTEKGSYDLVVRCTVCNEVISSEHVIVDALGHDWGDPEITWSEDHKSATATYTCKNDPSHTYTTEKIEATVTETPPTYEEDGKIVYTVTVEDPDGNKHTETYEETIPALKYDYQYKGVEWSEDNTKASAVFYDEKAGKTEKVEAVLSVKTTEATCTEDGKTVYTATISADKSLDGKEHVETKEVVIPKTGHSWGVWVYNGTEHTHTRTCENDTSHTETEDCQFDEGVTENGITTYTCQVCGGSYTVKEEGPVNPEVDGVIRVAGANRFGTSQAIASVYKLNNNVEKLDAVILANGDNFADALAGSYLAAEKNAPIIITRAGKESEVNAYIRSILNKGGTIYVLGGTAAVPESCLNGLTGRGYDIRDYGVLTDILPTWRS